MTAPFEWFLNNCVDVFHRTELVKCNSTGLSAVEFYWGIHGHKSFIRSITQKLDARTEAIGQELLAGLGPDDRALVIVTRQYGINDPVLNMIKELIVQFNVYLF